MSTVETDRRLFEGYLTVEMVDKQNEITMVDELIKCLPIWMARGAPISDTHSNRIIGKGINYAKTTITDEEGNTYPAIYIQGEIYKDYELDNDIWQMMKSGEYSGLSFGGATKSNRRPVKRKDGGFAYSLWDLEHYEVAVCRDPAVPLALITRTNDIAKSIAGEWEDRGNGEMCIKCDQFSCFVEKNGEDFSDVKGGNKPQSDAQSSALEDRHPRDESSHLGAIKADEEKKGLSGGKNGIDRHEDNDEFGQPLVGRLTTNPTIRPTSVVGDNTVKGNGDYTVNTMEVSSKKEEKEKQNTSTTMTAVGDVKDTVADDKKAPALEKDFAGTANQNMPGTRGAGQTDGAKQGPGESSQISLIDKEPEDKKKAELSKLLNLIKINTIRLETTNI